MLSVKCAEGEKRFINQFGTYETISNAHTVRIIMSTHRRICVHPGHEAGSGLWLLEMLLASVGQSQHPVPYLMSPVFAHS